LRDLGLELKFLILGLEPTKVAQLPYAHWSLDKKSMAPGAGIEP